MQRVVDNVLAVAKESVKTFTYESLNNVVRFINGVSAMLLAVLPGKSSVLEGMQGWELRPAFRGPRFPRWMENGVSSFNQFIHELSVESESSSTIECSSEGEESDNHPSSPLSQSSRLSRDSSFLRRKRNGIYWIIRILSWILFPIRFLLAIPLDLYMAFKTWVRWGKPRHINLHSPRRLQSLRNQFVQQATDRRRGVVEDLHLAFEIFIESIFDVVRKASHSILAPAETFRRVKKWFYSERKNGEDKASEVKVTAVGDPNSAETKTTIISPLNTDARTCEDVITELGYPYEAIRVVTADGYVLLLERIPRRDSTKVVYLQHGILDSSMGWVSNGVVGSPAFAAFDQGYDVYLGNFRGLVSREHTDKNLSSRKYWSYSINEHGAKDIPAMIEKIHEIKSQELKSKQSDPVEENSKSQPYEICSISHSLGGAAILMYAVTRQLEGKPHRLSRMILLSPGGFHHDSTFVFTAVEYMFLFLAPLLSPILPAFYIPTRFFRMLLNKLARDFNNLPAVGGLVQTLMSYSVGGDSSNWVGVLGLPHYNMNDMPGVSFRVALHLAQIKHAKKFRMFDYGSSSANMTIYGAPEPLDLGANYGSINIPVDLVAGKKDMVIKPSMVKKHYKLMKDSGVDVSYSEFEYAHLDFTFSHREELLSYVMSRLLLVGSSSKQTQKSKLRKLKTRPSVDVQ